MPLPRSASCIITAVNVQFRRVGPWPVIALGLLVNMCGFATGSNASKLQTLLPVKILELLYVQVTKPIVCALAADSLRSNRKITTS